jgi:hypothetical protein
LLEAVEVDLDLAVVVELEGFSQDHFLHQQQQYLIL